MSIGYQDTTAQLLTSLSMATMWEATCVQSLPVDWMADTCSCPCVSNCCDDELVLHDSYGVLNYKNDRTSMIFRKEQSGDGFSIKLYKKGTFAGITINANLGSYWNWGEISVEDTESEYAGFCLEWYLVYLIHGNGSYQLKGTITRQGQTYDYESKCFILRPFSCEIAKDTIKIQTIQNGLILSENINLTSFNWYSSMRLNGKLHKVTPKMTIDNFFNGQRMEKQIQDQVVDEYLLELWPMPNAIKNQIVYSMSMHNEIWISDYNVNQEKFDQVRLYVEEIPLAKTWQNNPDSRVNLKMKPKIQDTIKRNFARNFVSQLPVPPPSSSIVETGGPIIWTTDGKILWGPDPGQYIIYD